MASKNPIVSRAVIDYAKACKNPTGKATLAAARANLAAARIEDFIEKVLADAPPISDEQRSRLARLLTGGRGCEVKAKQRRRLRWFIDRWQPLGYTATYGASGHWKVRDLDGAYVATLSGSPRNEKAPEHEVERLLARHEKSRTNDDD